MAILSDVFRSTSLASLAGNLAIMGLVLLVAGIVWIDKDNRFGNGSEFRTFVRVSHIVCTILIWIGPLIMATAVVILLSDLAI